MEYYFFLQKLTVMESFPRISEPPVNLRHISSTRNTKAHFRAKNQPHCRWGEEEDSFPWDNIGPHHHRDEDHHPTARLRTSGHWYYLIIRRDGGTIPTSSLTLNLENSSTVSINDQTEKKMGPLPPPNQPICNILRDTKWP